MAPRLIRPRGRAAFLLAAGASAVALSEQRQHQEGYVAGGDGQRGRGFPFLGGLNIFGNRGRASEHSGSDGSAAEASGKHGGVGEGLFAVLGHHQHGRRRLFADRAAAEESTTPAPTYFGLPIYYEGLVPDSFGNFSDLERRDFYYKVERWHKLVAEYERGNCSYPLPGEKVIYVTLGAEVPNSGIGGERTPDAMLNVLGLAQVKNFQYDPIVFRPFSNPKLRPSLVITSPHRRAIETALLGFGALLPNATWEVNLDARGFSVEGAIKKALGQEMLEGFVANQTALATIANEMLAQYTSFPPGWNHDEKSHQARWGDLIHRLLNMTDRTALVVSHHFVFRQAEINVKPGEVQIFALTPKAEWRLLSPVECWPEGGDGI